MVTVEFWQVRSCPAPGCTTAAMNRSKWCKAYSEDLGRSGCFTFAIAGSPLSDAQRLIHELLEVSVVYHMCWVHKSSNHYEA
jgi:hypothetical protein